MLLTRFDFVFPGSFSLFAPAIAGTFHGSEHSLPSLLHFNSARSLTTIPTIRDCIRECWATKLRILIHHFAVCRIVASIFLDH